MHNGFAAADRTNLNRMIYEIHVGGFCFLSGFICDYLCSLPK